MVYYLRPNTSNRLVKVVTNGGGGLPLFNRNMVGMILQEPNGSTGKIVVYSLCKSTGVAKFNLLDIITGIWTGSGLVMPPPPRQPLSENTTAGHQAGSNSTGTKAGGNEPSATASSGSDDDQLTDSLVIIIGSVAGALCLLLAMVLCIIRRRRQNCQVASTFIMSSQVPPPKKHNRSFSVDPTILTMGGQPNMFCPKSPIQPLIHRHESHRNFNNSAEHLFAQGDQGSPLNISSPVPPSATATVAAAASTTIKNSYTYTPLTIPTIFRPLLSQLDLSSIAPSSSPTSLNTSITPSSSTVSTPDHLYFKGFRHLQHERSRAKKRQTGSQLTDEALSSSTILPSLDLYPAPVIPALVSVSSQPQQQPPTFSYTPSAVSMRGPHTVVSDDPYVQHAFKKQFAFQTTPTSIITLSNSKNHGAPSSSSYSPSFSNNR